MKRDIGLVLCGGGGRGAFQVGAWKALEENGYAERICAISGTSVGALNAALFVSKNCSHAANIWCSIRQDDLTDFSEIRNIINDLRPGFRPQNKIFELISKIIAQKGLFSRRGLEDLIASNNICSGVLNSPVPVYACYKNAATGKIIYSDMSYCRNESEVMETLFASSCIPFIFQMSGAKVDGGFLGDNTPIKPLYDIGVRKFIVISLDPVNEPDFSPFAGSELLFIKPSEKIYLEGNGTFVIGDGTIDFDGHNARRRIRLGYSETTSELRRCRPLLPDRRQTERFSLPQYDDDFMSDINEILRRYK